MTSTRALELTTQILADPTVAIPLLLLLNAFANSKGDPLSEAMTRDVMLHVWTKTSSCEEGMVRFLSEQEANPEQLAA